ncbi:MAG: helix-turn-helix transcriptional regulator [Actinomycetota bacterium]
MTSKLLEREAVIGEVSRCLQAARAGTGAALFVIGEAGLGKSSLLEAACGLASPSLVLGRARGDAIEEAISFGMAAEMFTSLGVGDPLGVEERGLVAALRSADASEPYYRALRGLRIPTGRGRLLVLDDLHWADPDSLRLIGFLTRRLPGLGVSLIATLRPWPPSAVELCTGLAEAGHATVERLQPLSASAAGVLLEDRLGLPLTGETSTRAWELCAGNPLLLEQVALAIARGEAMPGTSPEGAGSRGFTTSLLLSRFAGLDPLALACARAASVIGITFHPLVAAEVAGFAEREVDIALEALSRSGIFLAADDGPRGTMRFAHPLFAEALYRDLPAPLRSRHHARAFRIMAAAGQQAAAAEHAIRAGLVGDEQAAAVVEAAGRRAVAVGAVSGAVRLLQAAVEIAADPSANLRVALANALVANQRIDDALTTLRALLADPTLGWKDRHSALRALGRAYVMNGAVAEAGASLDEAIALALAHDPALAVEPLLDQCVAAWVMAGPPAALPLAARARELAQTAPRELAQRAEATWGRLAFESGDPGGLVVTTSLVDRLKSAPATGAFSPEEFVFLGGTIEQVSACALESESFGDGELGFRAIQAAANGAGAVGALISSSFCLATLLVRQGRLQDALAEVRRGQELSDLHPTYIYHLELCRAEILVWLGRLEDAEKACRGAEAISWGNWLDRVLMGHVRGHILLRRGDQAASEAFLETDELTREAGLREPCVVQWAGHAVEAHLAARQPEDAARVVAWLEDCAGHLPCRWPRIAAHLGKAALAASSGGDEEAADQFRRALALHAEVELPLLRAEALLAYGGFLRRRHRLVEARAPLAEALRLSKSLGADLIAGPAARELALAGGRRRKQSAVPGSLTPAQHRVVLLAAQGATNAEIARSLHLSTATVETHLSHAYLKLGVTSRRELKGLAVPPSD